MLPARKLIFGEMPQQSGVFFLVYGRLQLITVRLC